MAAFRSAGNLQKAAPGTSGRLPFQGGQVRCFNARSRTRDPRCCSASTEATGKTYSIAETARHRKELQQQLTKAVKEEAYAQAATLKQQLALLDAGDPVAQAKAALEQAVKEERYQDAAKVQAQLKQLQAELGAAALDAGLLSTSSDTVTRGVRVKVESYFAASQSDPRNDRFMFVYKILIVNESDQIVQLRQRHWVIMDGNGKTEEVRGPGVVGEQPILVPGKSFEYVSGCPLITSQGSMEGEYTMWLLDEKSGEWKDTMEVQIGRFKLDMNGKQVQSLS